MFFAILINLFLTNRVLSPNETDVWHINHKYDIKWDVPDTVMGSPYLFN